MENPTEEIVKLDNCDDKKDGEINGTLNNQLSLTNSRVKHTQAHYGKKDVMSTNNNTQQELDENGSTRLIMGSYPSSKSEVVAADIRTITSSLNGIPIVKKNVSPIRKLPDIVTHNRREEQIKEIDGILTGKTKKEELQNSGHQTSQQLGSVSNKANKKLNKGSDIQQLAGVLTRRDDTRINNK
ncbi:hypothetical protein HAX54_052934 [Datura stramonium]|uniref:Uncharacterized protein n=1 Tax=Datura stramonium TaxID=4076 RepID=A0ABS8T0K2_DATST|nr:hypothetical protein [Datura stramonium]